MSAHSEVTVSICNDLGVRGPRCEGNQVEDIEDEARDIVVAHDPVSTPLTEQLDPQDQQQPL